MPVLESYRGRDIVGVEEMASVAASLIEHYSREPLRAHSRMNISPALVRQYLSESLLGEPTGQTGASMVFNYGNLLRLLAVKKLLSDHWSIIKVREFMRKLDITALEEMVNTALLSLRLKGEGAKGAEHDGAKPLRATEPLSPADAPDSLAQNAAFPSTHAPQLTSLAAESARRHDRAVTEWVEIAPGLEIKVRRSFRAPASEEERSRLAARFWSVIMKEDE